MLHFLWLLFLLFITWKLSAFFHSPFWNGFKHGFLVGLAKSQRIK